MMSGSGGGSKDSEGEVTFQEILQLLAHLLWAELLDGQAHLDAESLKLRGGEGLAKLGSYLRGIQLTKSCRRSVYHAPESGAD